jgi:hypothetical protein
LTALLERFGHRRACFSAPLSSPSPSETANGAGISCRRSLDFLRSFRDDIGLLTGTVRFDPGLRRGAVSLPNGFAGVNVSDLTSGTVGVDPLTGMVLQSGLPVTVGPVEDPRHPLPPGTDPV